MNWPDVANNAIEFLKKPNAIAFGIIMVFAGFLIYTVPLGIVTYTSLDNTSRLERSSKENTDRLEKAIVTAISHCSQQKEIASK